MTTVAHNCPFVIGVDTHAGRSRAIAWAARRTGGDLGALWVIEGTGSYGALLASIVIRSGYRVVEALRVRAYATARRGAGKSDPLDAAAIAAAALPLEESELGIPRQDDGVRAALRVLVATREQMTVERTTKVNALMALRRSVDMGVDVRRPLSDSQFVEISHWRRREEDLDSSVDVTRCKARVHKSPTGLATPLSVRLSELLATALER